MELWKKLELGENDAVWRLSARRHSPLHNNEPELIDYFASPLGIRESICSAGVAFKRGRTSSSHLRKQMPFALHVAANEYRIASRCPPASLPAKRQFFRMIAIPLLSRSAGYSNVRISGIILIIWLLSGFGDSCLIYLFFMPNPEDNVFVWYSKSPNFTGGDLCIKTMTGRQIK